MGNRVRIKRLVLSNFRTFVGTHTIDFPDSGLAIVQGKNLDTGGSSGAGKSNVFIAISYALKFCSFSAKDLQSWLTDDPFCVELHLQTDDYEAILIRGHNKLSLDLAGQTITGSAAVEQQLDLICGVSKDLRELLTYRSQRRPTKFLAMGDLEMKEFLTTVLGLQKLEEAIDTTADELKKLEADFNDKEQRVQLWREIVEKSVVTEPTLELTDDAALESIASQKRQLQLQLAEDEDDVVAKQAEIEKAVANLSLEKDQEVDALNEQIEQFVESLTKLPNTSPELERLLGLQGECASHIQSVTLAEKERKSLYDRETTSFHKEQIRLHNELARATEIVDRLRQYRASVASLEKDRCSMCERTWDNAKLKLAEFIEQINEDELQLQQIVALKPKLTSLEAVLASRCFIPDPILVKLESAYSTLSVQVIKETEKLSQAEQQIRTRILGIESQIKDIKLAASTIKLSLLSDPSSELAGAKQKSDTTRSSLEAVKKEYDRVSHSHELVRQKNLLLQQTYKQEVARAAEDVHRFEMATEACGVAEQKLHQESDYFDLLKGFRNRIFDEVLQAIGEEASNILIELPNVCHVSLEFKSDRETAKGVVKERITPVIYLYGHPRKMEALSGGQQTSVELAVDLAIARVVSQRLNCNLSWVMLDESFEGHDVPTKEACLTMLQHYAEDKLVLVIDHATEVREMFSQVITVQMQEQRSSLV